MTIPDKGIYLLQNKEDVIYVGKSENSMTGRVSHHSARGVVFDTITFYEILNAADRNLIEIYLISQYKTQLNRDCKTTDLCSVAIDITPLIVNTITVSKDELYKLTPTTTVIERIAAREVVLNEQTSDEIIGKLYRYANTVEIPANLQTTFMHIGAKSLAEGKKTTNIISDFELNPTLTQISMVIGISKPKLREDIKKLVGLEVLKVHKGSLYRNGGGSYPDYYSIVFDKDIQIKHNLFFNLDGVKTKTNNKEIDVLDYFKDGLGGVFPIKVKGKSSKQWIGLLDSKTRKAPSTDEEWVKATPTIEEVKNGKYTQQQLKENK